MVKVAEEEGLQALSSTMEASEETSSNPLHRWYDIINQQPSPFTESPHLPTLTSSHDHEMSDENRNTNRDNPLPLHQHLRQFIPPLVEETHALIQKSMTTFDTTQQANANHTQSQLGAISLHGLLSSARDSKERGIRERHDDENPPLPLAAAKLSPDEIKINT